MSALIECECESHAHAFTALSLSLSVSRSHLRTAHRAHTALLLVACIFKANSPLGQQSSLIRSLARSLQFRPNSNCFALFPLSKLNSLLMHSQKPNNNNNNNNSHDSLACSHPLVCAYFLAHKSQLEPLLVLLVRCFTKPTQLNSNVSCIQLNIESRQIKKNTHTCSH